MYVFFVQISHSFTLYAKLNLIFFFKLIFQLFLNSSVFLHSYLLFASYIYVCSHCCNGMLIYCLSAQVNRMRHCVRTTSPKSRICVCVLKTARLGLWLAYANLL